MSLRSKSASGLEAVEGGDLLAVRHLVALHQEGRAAVDQRLRGGEVEQIDIAGLGVGMGLELVVVQVVATPHLRSRPDEQKLDPPLVRRAKDLVDLRRGE